LTIFAKAERLVDLSQPKGLKYKDNHGLAEVNQPTEMQKLSKNPYFISFWIINRLYNCIKAYLSNLNYIRFIIVYDIY